MFVTLEGPEGAGKSTAALALKAELEAREIPVLLTREPGAGELGRQIRQILLHGGDMPALSELFLFLADRANHVETIIRPALELGTVVICDRFTDSTVVYQGYARGLELGMLRNLNRLATGSLSPDLTLLFDLDIEIGLGRIKDKDRLDQMDKSFHQKVREGFLTESNLEPTRWKTLDATKTPAEISQQALQAILERI